MSPASWSLVALIVALVVSMTSRINVGWLGLAFLAVHVAYPWAPWRRNA